MFWLYYIASGLKLIKHRRDINWVDRLNFHWSVLFLLCSSITVTTKQYVGCPIECWVPATFTAAMEEYAESHCWVANTYWIPFNDTLPRSPGIRQHAEVAYYQWVPFILALQAFMLAVPCLIWRALYWQTGLDISAIVETAVEIRIATGDVRQKLLALMSQHLWEVFNKQQPLRLQGRCIMRALRGRYVSVLSFWVRSLSILDCFVQLLLLNSFLNTTFPLYGLQLLADLWQARRWSSTGRFPRVTMCDFEVREIAAVHRYTIQCVLLINMFNEKIFFFLWFWFMLLLLLSMTNLCALLYYNFCISSRMDFLDKYLFQPDCEYDKHGRHNFLTKFLDCDGMFVLRNIAGHAGDLVATELTTTLYAWYAHEGRPPTVSFDMATTTISTTCCPPNGGILLTSKYSRSRRKTARRGQVILNLEEKRPHRRRTLSDVSHRMRHSLTPQSSVNGGMH